TRHCLYTGLYPVKSGAYPNHTFAKPGTRSIAHYLGDAGYSVALSGKSHVSPRAVFPFETSGKKGNPDLEAIDGIMAKSKASGKPFCVLACSNEPHMPYNLGDPSVYPPEKVELPPHYVDTPETRVQFSKYLAEISYYDWQVGELMKLLDKHDLADDTLVLVFSEQGNAFPFAKWTCYERGLQSGLIARWPGQIPAGKSTDAMVEYVDVVPTFLEAAEVEVPAVLEGKSFLTVLEGKTDQHKDFSFGIHTTKGIINGSPHYGIRTVRGKRYRYIRNLTPEETFRNIVSKHPYYEEWLAKAAGGDAHAQEVTQRYSTRPGEELYDCQTDPWNLNNLAGNAEFVSVKSDLSNRLDDWMRQQGDMGQATELEAHKHQSKGRKKKRGQEKASEKKKVRETQEFAVAGKKFAAPAGWKKEQPTSNMRKAQFRTGETEIVVFYFGAGQGGGTQANVARWMKQFKDPSDQAASSESIGKEKTKVTTVTAKGTFLSGPPFGQKVPKPGYALRGAIIELADGPVFIKMTGPEAEVAKAAEEFDLTVRSAFEK
ncbi:MAG: sulfatase family protein, partial [Verrucomicrobiales bacterium]